jgi:hypothetical protein
MHTRDIRLPLLLLLLLLLLVLFLFLPLLLLVLVADVLFLLLLLLFFLRLARVVTVHVLWPVLDRRGANKIDVASVHVDVGVHFNFRDDDLACVIGTIGPTVIEFLRRRRWRRCR